MRAADLPPARQRPRIIGSSPQTRSRPASSPHSYGAARLIPACAEQTKSYRRLNQRQPAHPRVRGADTIHESPRAGGSGSSPRARSRRLSGHALRLDLRLIPACAEQTWPGSATTMPRLTHPRVRGADVHGRGAAAGLFDSIPACAEQTGIQGERVPYRWLIPACAEQTAWKQTASARMPAHPRTCGADPLKVVHLGPFTGSSPHMRSRPSLVSPFLDLCGLIFLVRNRTLRPRRAANVDGNAWVPPSWEQPGEDASVRGTPPDSPRHRRLPQNRAHPRMRGTGLLPDGVDIVIPGCAEQALVDVVVD